LGIVKPAGVPLKLSKFHYGKRSTPRKAFSVPTAGRTNWKL